MCDPQCAHGLRSRGDRINPDILGALLEADPAHVPRTFDGIGLALYRWSLPTRNFDPWKINGWDLHDWQFEDRGGDARNKDGEPLKR